MSKEKMKLALEVLKAAYVPADLDEQRERVITVFEVELAKPDFWEGYVPEPVKPAQQEPVACECHRCIDEKGLTVNGLPLSMTKMILCPECGNKRCPKASDHRLACTNSNDPGQPGSIYTSPPAQRTWVGLVWGELPEDGQNHDFLRGAVWAETKLKEKNQ